MVRHQNLLVIIAILWLAVIIFAVKMQMHQTNTSKNLSKRISFQNNNPSLTAVYGPYVNNQANVLDLWLPAYLDTASNGKVYPLVVFIHGGAWEGGDKSIMTCQGQFIDSGYAVASINYRSTHETAHPAQIEDCKRAISWLRSHARLLKIDPDRIGVWGVSAGGHLAALLGTTCDTSVYPWESPEKVSSSVQAVCDWCGPTDLKTIAKEAGTTYILSRAVKLLLGGSPEDKPELADEVSPVTHVHKGCPPFLIVHGQDDTIVPVEQSEELAKALKSARSNCTLEIIPGANHNFYNVKTINRVIQFFDLVLKKHG
jgi:acetyl esterase/lipase